MKTQVASYATKYADLMIAREATGNVTGAPSPIPGSSATYTSAEISAFWSNNKPMLESRIGDLIAGFIKEYAKNDTSAARAYTARWTSVSDAISKLGLDGLTGILTGAKQTKMPAPFRWIESGNGRLGALHQYKNQWQGAMLRLGTSETIRMPGSEQIDNNIDYQRYAGIPLQAVSGTLQGKNGQPGTDESAGGDQGDVVTETPPTNLSYSPSTLTLTKNQAMTEVVPTVTGTVDTWTISPDLPPGLLFDPGSGAIKGKPTNAVASRDHLVTAGNDGGDVDTTITIVIENIPAPSNLSYTPSTFTLTKDVAMGTSAVPSVTGTVENWRIDRSLPSGLTFDSTNGTISGTPNQITASTSYEIEAANSGGSTKTTITLEVQDPRKAESEADMEARMEEQAELIVEVMLYQSYLDFQRPAHNDVVDTDFGSDNNIKQTSWFYNATTSSNNHWTRKKTRSRKTYMVFDMLYQLKEDIVNNLKRALVKAEEKDIEDGGYERRNAILDLVISMERRSHLDSSHKPHPLILAENESFLLKGESRIPFENIPKDPLRDPSSVLTKEGMSLYRSYPNGSSGFANLPYTPPSMSELAQMASELGALKGSGVRKTAKRTMPDHTSVKLAGQGVRMVGEGLLDTAGKQYPENVPYVQTSEDLEDEYAQLTYDRKRKLRFGMQEDKPEKMQRMFQYRNVRRPTWDKGKRIIPEGGRSVRSLYKPAASVRSMNVNGLPTLPPPIKPKTYDVRYDDKGFKLVEKVPTRRGVPIRRPQVVQDLQADARARQTAEALGEERRQAREDLERSALQEREDLERSALFDELPGMVDLPTGQEQVLPPSRMRQDILDRTFQEMQEPATDEGLGQIAEEPLDPRSFSDYTLDPFAQFDPLGGSGMNPRLARMQAQMRNHKNFRNYGGRGMARKGAGSNLMG